MKKQSKRRLELNKHTIRTLTARTLERVAGGLSYNACRQDTVLYCPQPSIGNTACADCATDVDCASGAQCLTFETGC